MLGSVTQLAESIFQEIGWGHNCLSSEQRSPETDRYFDKRAPYDHRRLLLGSGEHQRIGCGFLEFSVVFQLTKHFICGHLHKERICILAPGILAGLKQNAGAKNVGLNKRSWVVDRSIDMGFRSEVEHCIKAMLQKKFFEKGGIVDGSVYEFKGFRQNVLKIHEIAGVRQYSIPPNDGSSSPCTSIAQKWEPINPAPPVTNVDVIFRGKPISLPYQDFRNVQHRFTVNAFKSGPFVGGKCPLIVGGRNHLNLRLTLNKPSLSPR